MGKIVCNGLNRCSKLGKMITRGETRGLMAEIVVVLGETGHIF